MDKEQTAIERLKAASSMSLAYYHQPLVVTTSGGKDSSVCVELARRAGIPFEIQHNHTTADAPETVRFVRREFARLESIGIKCPVNPLYGCGFKRVGCIGCPMAGKSRSTEFARYPKYEAAYIRAFDNMLAERQRRGKMQGSWQMETTGRDVFNWWMENGILPGQITIDDYIEAMGTYE